MNNTCVLSTEHLASNVLSRPNTYHKEGCLRICIQEAHLHTYLYIG